LIPLFLTHGIGEEYEKRLSPSAGDNVSLGLVLRFERVIGQIIGPVYKHMSVIRLMYKFCLLTTTLLVCDIEAESDGSGAGGLAVGQEKPG
jgi:hypothetical protein